MEYVSQNYSNRKYIFHSLSIFILPSLPSVAGELTPMIVITLGCKIKSPLLIKFQRFPQTETPDPNPHHQIYDHVYYLDYIQPHYESNFLFIFIQITHYKAEATKPHLN